MDSAPDTGTNIAVAEPKLARTLALLGFALAIATLRPLQGLAAGQEGLSARALEQIQILQSEKASRTPAQRKLDSQLHHALRQRKSGSVAAGLNAFRPEVRLEADERVLVDVHATVTPGLLQFIERNGGQVVNSVARHRAIRARVSLALVEQLAARPEVRSLRPADEAITNTGPINSGGDMAHRADQVRSAYAVNGAGIKIGVLSDSVDQLAASQAAGELPAVTILPGQAGAGAGEGTAMLEIIHDLAPGAELYFATAFSGVASFAQNIRDLHAAGCRIIVDDVIYFVESPLQDGPISQAVNDVSAGGALFFSSAGNGGSKLKKTSGTWEGDFKDGGPATLGGGGRLHDFGGLTYNTVLPGGGLTRLDLFWADPLGASTNDYDVYVLNSADQVVRSSTNVQDGDDDPYESLPFLGVGERVVIVKNSGADRFLSLMTLRGRLTISTPGSVRGHNASGAGNAFSVAAARVSKPPGAFDSINLVEVEPFSSDGPRRMFFNPDGSAITPGNYSSTGGLVLEKPDITAADGVATSVPGFGNFLGTSAAAPHAGAIAALLWSHKPLLTPAEVRAFLSVPALDIEGAGFDLNSGAGIVMADRTFAPSPRLVVQAVQVADASGNGGLDANECADLYITLRNVALPVTQVVTGITAVLSCSTPGVTVAPFPQAFPAMPPGSIGTNQVGFRISTVPLFNCGSNASFRLSVSTSNQIQFELPFQLESTATPIGAPIISQSTTPVPIPDLGVAESTVLVTNLNQLLERVRVAVHLTHTFDYDLRLSLISPDGTEVLLSTANGGDGHDYGTSCEVLTVFSDDAATNITAGTAPFVGMFKPQQPLAAFHGKSGPAVNGLWRLQVRDEAALDSGTLRCWSLELYPLDCTDGGGQCLLAPLIVQGPANQSATEGDTVQFTVQVQGTEPFVYQWLFAPATNAVSNNLAVGTNATLTINNVRLANAGTYSVLVSNVYGQQLSAAATLSVRLQPLLTCATNRTVELGAVWDFDAPQVFGDGTTLSVLSTTTNAGCGEGYNAIRSWLATGTNGVQSSCAQTITVLDTQPPTIACVADKTVTLGEAWQFDVPTSTAAGAVASVVYDNSLNDLLYRFDPGTKEVGDEIILDGSARWPAQFAFEFWGIGTNNGSFTGGVRARLRFYRNDGPLASGYATPGSLLFDSGPFPIPATPRATARFENLQLEALLPLTQPLPESFTWTVQFSGLASGDSAGLDLYSPPVVGNNYTDYWEWDGGDWQLKDNLGVSMDFAARLVASSRGVILTELAAVTNPPVAVNDGYVVIEGSLLTVSAPGVLGNDKDVKGNPLAAVLENGVLHGSLALNADGSFVYTPGANYSGPDSFHYRLSSAGISSSVAKASLMVLATDTIAPSVPQNLTGSVTNAITVQLAWQAASDNVGVIRYLIRRDGTLIATVSGSETSFQDTGLAPATRYSYGVEAEDAFGNLSPPATTTVLTQAGVGTTAVVRINAGGETFVDDANNLWLADEGFNTGQTYSTSAPITGTTNGALYQSERYDSSPSPDLVYSFSLTNGDYLVNLHFAEIWSDAFAVGARVFDVWMEDQLRVDNLDIFNLVGSNAALILSLPVTINDGQLDIAFAHGVENPKISAIEVLVNQSVPEGPLPNAVPMAVNDTYSVSQGDVLNVSSPGVVANDTDADGDVLAAWLETDVRHGTLLLNRDGSFLYAPNNNYSGQDSFSYQASDGRSSSVPAVVSLNVASGGPPGNTTIITRTWQAVDECGNSAVCSQTVTIEDTRPPLIVSDPESQTVTSGDAVTFNVIAMGAAPLSYQWQFNETNLLSAATRPDLVLTNVQADNAGLYFAIISNTFGVVTSAVATLTVWERPSITQPPASLAVEAGQDASFSATAIGTEPLAYQWFFNDATILDATNSLLQVQSVQATNAGRYVVVVTNLVGSVTSQVAILFVGLPALLCGTDRTVEFGTPWDFDSPLTSGDEIMVNVLATVTNAACGDGFTATRTWRVSDTNGSQASCSQTVTVLDKRPPTLVCAPDKVVPFGTDWSFDGPVGRAAGAVPSVVYDNSQSDLSQRFDPGVVEVGDEINLAGPADHLGQFAFSFWGVATNAGSFTGDVRARLRFYRNDGPVSASGQAAPETVLFDSGLFPIPATPRATLRFEDFQIDAEVPLTTPLPGTFTWTIKFSGLGTGDAAGLDLFSAPAVGGDRASYWERDGVGWVEKTNSMPVDFAARLIALSRGVVVTEIGTVTNGPARNTVTFTRSWRATDDCGNSATCSQTVTVVDSQPPQISLQPQSQTVNTGEDVTFAVAATGAAPLHYRWRSNGTNILAGAAESSLLLTNVQATNNGDYVVVVSNAFGTVTSAVATLNVFSVPWIVSQPGDQNVSPGDSASFAVEVAAWPPPAYQWFFNETNLLAGETASTLNVANAQSEQAGVYSVVVTNSQGTVTSRLARLVLGVPAFIAVQPQPLTLIPGQTAAFTVSPGGTPPFTFQWYFNCLSPIAAATSQTLLVANVSVADSGPYCVMVSNAYGSAFSAPATLRVLTPPDVFFITRTGTVVTVTFSTVTNQFYTVQFIDDIQGTEWSALRKGSHRPGTGFPIILQDLHATGPQRYYRLRIE